jgi:hypothetical protein
MAKYGFTGTHHGATAEQKLTLRALLTELREKLVSTDPLDRDTFAHGDCIGADAQANDIAWECGYHITVHPPHEPRGRFFCKAGAPPQCISSIAILQKFEILPTKPYLVRDRDIVNGAVRMFACPAGTEEELRSGTWATIRYARKKKVPITLIWPDGTISEE